MTWRYDQSSGELTRDGAHVGTGYSGFGAGKNSPEREAMPGVGPIPAGRWRIASKYDSAKVGPYALVLEPNGADPHGRSAFRIHGDSIAHPGTASHGCIILARVLREMIWTSGDRDLEVLP